MKLQGLLKKKTMWAPPGFGIKVLSSDYYWKECN